MPTPQSLAALPPGVLEHLEDDIAIVVSTTVRLRDTSDAPGVTFYAATVRWEYTLGYSDDDDDERAVAWAATHGAAPDRNGQLDVSIGGAQVATISRFAPDGTSQLDSISSDFDTFGAVLSSAPAAANRTRAPSRVPANWVC